MSSQAGGGSQVRANWTPEWHKLFIDICLQQVRKGNRPKTHLNRQGWKELCKEFSRKTGVTYDKRQLKNHWDNTKDAWKAWHKLIFNIGAVWDPITRKMNSSDDFWDDYLERNPSAARYRNQTLPHCQELDYIFGGTTAIGDFQWKRNSGLAHNYDQGPVEPLLESDEDDGTPDAVHEAQQQSSNDVDIMAKSTPTHVRPRREA
ncbi:hypothetical protein IFM89_038339 [Coptis chinensis]|uniref:Myb/SANT-like domain-containing protein n=1 Tax=Coptis chinensis TaxID=261450 RepID=A0A835I6I1_9MAGN|nr:hypothetical protein IFM89_038339 [Coptis chinensis]